MSFLLYVIGLVVLVGGIAFVGTYLSKSAPHDQTIGVRLAGRDVTRISGVVTQLGDDEPTAGFSQDFSATSRAPRVIRHEFSAPNGTYIVVISLRQRMSGGAEAPAQPRVREQSPIPTETSFQRRVSLAGGEVIISPD